MDQKPGSPKLPAYRSHKIVHAAKIVGRAAIDVGAGSPPRWLLHLEGGAEVEAANADRHYIGGYHVRYDDGYTSWSPAAAFEAGYTRLSEWGVPRQQEPKYGVNEKGRLFNRASGVPIPDEEPLFVFRGKDALLPAVLKHYAELLRLNHREVEAQAVEYQLLAVNGFQHSYGDRVRIPGEPGREVASNPGQEA